MTKYEVNIIDVDKFNRDFGDEYEIDLIADLDDVEIIETMDNLCTEGYLIHCEGFNTLKAAIDYLNRKYISKTFIEDVEVQIAEQGFYYDYDVVILPFKDE